jgi:DNA-binding NarL/FixJ family response regulator
MKIINLTVVTAGQASGSCPADLLDTVRGVNVVALPSSLHDPGVWVALGLSDVLVLDEAAIAQNGAAVVQSMHAGYPALRTLLLVAHDDNDVARAAFSLGIHGVMRYPVPAERLRQAISMLHETTSMTSEEFGKPSANRIDVDAHRSITAHTPRVPVAWGKLH